MLKYFYEFYKKRDAFYLKNSLTYFFISIITILFWVFAFKSTVLDANTIPTGSMIPTLKIGDLLFVNKMRYKLIVPFTNIELMRLDTPQRGDIVTFTPPVITNYDPNNLVGKTLVKRIVGVPGDVINIKDNDVYINDKPYTVSAAKNRKPLEDIDYPDACSTITKDDLVLEREIMYDAQNQKILNEHYIMQINPEKFPLVNDSLRNPNNMPIIIPENKYMLMGDNRDNSTDSRIFGLVDLHDIHGKVFMVYFSINWNESSHCVQKEYTSLSILTDNPIAKFLKKIFGFYEGSYVRWNRIGTIIQ